MAEVLARVQLSPIFRNFRQRIESLRDDIVIEGGKILRQEEEASIRTRWYDRGRTLRSLQERIDTEGDSKIYRLFPTYTRKGAPIPLFGEYGTGQRGAATGKPAPTGYTYSTDWKGMAARRYSRIAVAQAKPKIIGSAKQLIANFTVS